MELHLRATRCQGGNQLFHVHPENGH